LLFTLSDYHGKDARIMKKIHHVALRTKSIASLEAFYAGVLGLDVIKRDEDRSVWLALGDAVLMIERAGDDERTIDARSATLDMMAFAIEEKDHARYVQKLCEAKIAIESESAFTLYFRDPDGRRVGLSFYAFA
jgi:catechol-2,3-dioxygenase